MQIQMELCIFLKALGERQQLRLLIITNSSPEMHYLVGSNNSALLRYIYNSSDACAYKTIFAYVHNV